MQALKGIERAVRRLVPKRWRKYLQSSRYALILERRAPVDLIVHVGAHWGEDAGLYEDHGARTVLWIEADPDTHAELARRLAERKGPARHLSVCALVSSAPGSVLSFHRFTGDGASSSVHHAAEALTQRFPHVGESGEVLDLPTASLPELMAAEGVDPQAAKQAMLVVDVQGHELEVLSGLGDGLAAFAMCKCEVSRVPLYEGGARFEEIDAHMRAHGFRLASHLRAMVPRHGDVLYLREERA